MKKFSTLLRVALLATVLMTSCVKPNKVVSIDLNQATLSLEVGQSQTLSVTVLPADATVTWTSSNTNVASIANGVVTANAAGTATITAKAGDKTATCTVSVIIPFSTIINGIKWATRNVGTTPKTFTTNPEDYGGYYDWNEAQTVCPDGWRLPTKSEIESLITAGSTWTPQGNKDGRRFGDVNSNIFLPAAGQRRDGSLDYVGQLGEYQSVSVYENDATKGYYLRFNSSGAGVSPIQKQGFKLSVRCVAK